jgi:hypothetical protein
MRFLRLAIGSVFLRALQQQVKRLARRVEREQIVLAAIFGAVIADHRARPGARKSDHERDGEANGHKHKHIEAALPPLGCTGASRPQR